MVWYGLYAVNYANKAGFKLIGGNDRGRDWYDILFLDFRAAFYLL